MKLRQILPALLLAACGAHEGVDPAAGGAALMRNLLRAGAVEVFAGPGLASGPLHRAASLRSRELDGYEMRFADGEELLPRVVLGSYADALAGRLAEPLGLRTGVQAGQPWFSIAGQEFRAPDDALVACFEDPERPGLPVTLYYANDDEHLGRLIARELAAGWKPSLRVWSGGREVLSGPLALDGRSDPERLVRTDPASDFETFARGPERIRGRAQPGIDAQQFSAALAKIVLGRAALCAWAAPQAELPEIEVIAYALPEDYTRVAGSAEAAVLDPLARRVHVCISSRMPAEGAAAAARAAGRKLLGECALPWLEDGAAVDAAGTWWGEPLDDWLAWIAARGLGLPLERVVDARADANVSPHLLLPLRAALFRLVRAQRGDAELRALWSGARDFAADAALAKAFGEALAARAAGAPAGLATRRGPGFPALDASGRQAWRGVEGEPTRGGAGWASAAGALSAVQAQELGANAYGVRVSIVARQDPLALPDPFHPRRMGTREGDLQVWTALAVARALRLWTFVDLDVLATPSGVEDGAWQRVRPEPWARFFAAQESALVHAGLLAQLGRADALSIGCDLPAVTRGQLEGRKGSAADLEAKRAGWSASIARARACFEGALVYVATPADLSLVVFAKELDALGYRLDIRLEPGFRDTPAERAALAQRLAGTLQQLALDANGRGQPWFLARTAFEPARAPIGASAMRTQIEVLGDVLRGLPPASRPSASFLWRWPSDPQEQPLDPRDVLLPRGETLEALRGLWQTL